METLKQLLEALVNEPDQMARMQLIEDNTNLVAEPTAIDTTQFESKISELETALATASQALADANAKYIKTFFSGKEEEKSPEEKKDPSMDDVADSFVK